MVKTGGLGREREPHPRLTAGARRPHLTLVGLDEFFDDGQSDAGTAPPHTNDHTLASGGAAKRTESPRTT